MTPEERRGGETRGISNVLDRKVEVKKDIALAIFSYFSKALNDFVGIKDWLRRRLIKYFTSLIKRSKQLFRRFLFIFLIYFLV